MNSCFNQAIYLIFKNGVTYKIGMLKIANSKWCFEEKSREYTQGKEDEVRAQQAVCGGWCYWAQELFIVDVTESRELFGGGGAIDAPSWVCEELSRAAADGWEPILHPGTLYSRRLFINDLMPPEGALLLRHSSNKQELIYLIFKSYAIIKK